MDTREIAQITSVLVLTLGVTGCAASAAPYFYPAAQASQLAWRTEGRVKLRWAGVVRAGQMPVDLHFRTQAACEAFRAQHPSYTRLDEVCQPVRGEWGTWQQGQWHPEAAQ
jgi:hypothetical protein